MLSLYFFDPFPWVWTSYLFTRLAHLSRYRLSILSLVYSHFRNLLLSYEMIHPSLISTNLQTSSSFPSDVFIVYSIPYLDSPSFQNENSFHLRSSLHCSSTESAVSVHTSIISNLFISLSLQSSAVVQFSSDRELAIFLEKSSVLSISIKRMLEFE